MILDEILEAKSDSTNPWLDMILEYKNKNWWEKYKKKNQLRKVSKTTTPTIETMVDMAETIQSFGKYLFYNNNKDTATIASYKKNKSNIIVFIIDKDNPDGLKCVIDISNNMVVKLTILTKSNEVQYSTSWNESSIQSVIQHKYDAYLFENIVDILMKRFFDLVISYI
jgi:hypothetical protein